MTPVVAFFKLKEAFFLCGTPSDLLGIASLPVFFVDIKRPRRDRPNGSDSPLPENNFCIAELEIDSPGVFLPNAQLFFFFPVTMVT